MRYIVNKIKKKLRENKILVLSIIFVVLLVVSVAIPTLSQFKNSIPTHMITSWDGTMANSYEGGDGTAENPYIISNGNQLLYFASQLKTTKYEGEYFILNNDIILNDGVFDYTKNEGVRYIKAENIVTPSEENNTINVFEHLDGFKGTIDGNHHVIYGLYIDKPIEEQNALFTNLEGNISNLHIKNSIIYGGKIVGGVVSKSQNSKLTNISYDGFVVSDENVSNKIINLEVNDIKQNVTTNEFIDYINITNFNFIPGTITEITLSGIYETNAEAILKINDEIINQGEFKLNLNNKIKTSIPIIYQTTSESESIFTLKNLKYELKYDYGNASGIVSIAENTILKNIINKSNVYASVYASGIVNTISGESTLKNAYNTGNIESINTSSGLISNINQNSNEINITNCYNNGVLLSNSNSMIGNIENNIGTITLNNVFNTQDNFVINLIYETNVNINNSYVIFDKGIKFGNSNGDFILTTLENLKNKTFVKTNLKYEEYANNEELEGKVWVWSFDTDALPILYIDELNEPIANIYIKEHIWEDYKTKLETLKFSNTLVFSIEEANALNSIKEIYYYISNEKETLSKEEINAITDWQKYESIVEINEEGFYIIYAKIIDDNNNEIYLNTDLLVIDLTGADITISTSYISDTWKSFKTELNNHYIDREINVNINAVDSLSGINKIYYYISDTVLLQEEVKMLEEWNVYTEEISITDSKSIVYVKVVDNYNYSTYANSDLFILNGYTLNSISPGMNGDSNENVYITENSSVSLTYTYQDTNEYSDGSTHQLISNVLLPQNTKITLIDKIKNKVYVYKTTDDDYGYNDCRPETDECKAIYDFDLFNEVGSINKFEESNYTGTINENFVVIIDFKETKITKNIENITISLKINNEKTNEIRNTLVNSQKVFNVIYADRHATFELTTSFKDTINYNENAQYIIDFVAKTNYLKINDDKIFDTTFENKNFGLSIKMVDNEGNIVSKQYLKNILFKIGNKKYSPSNDGIIRINLEKGIGTITDNLIIQTYSDNSNLKEGDYKFIITLYVAYDGINSNENLTNIEIPVHIGENIYNKDNSFNVIMNNDDKIVTTETNEFNFELLVGTLTENLNIKMSLYKKESLSVDNQNYTIINLGDYLIDSNLEKYSENIYFVSKKVKERNTFKVNLNTSLLEKNGYMFVFELYDDDKMINRINEKFIVK